MTDLIDKLSEKARKNSHIEDHWFKEQGIKKGLRNEDGTGVRVILTEISDVIGYNDSERVDGKPKPIDGKLVYRGIEINDLIWGVQKEKRFGFEETAYLLMFGESPNESELKEFSEELAKQRKLPEGFLENIILPFPSRDIMNKLETNVTVLYRTDQNPDDISLDNVIKQCISLIAKFPTMIAYSYQAKRHSIDGKSLFIHKPNGSKSTAESFLYMLREDMKFEPLEAQVLDMALILLAEHSGGNASTFTLRTSSSTHNDTYSAIVGALGALKGSLHGGASTEVMEMMGCIKKGVKNWENDGQVVDYLGKILKHEEFDHSGLIYGFGHAIYKKSDPRAEILKEKARELASAKGKTDEFNLYLKVAELVPEAVKTVKGSNGSNNLGVVNVDYFSGFVYDCLGFPIEVCTPIFAMSRIAGWSAHRIEEIQNGRIMRPASVYVGPQNQQYKPLIQR
jgi:citrate synthase